jgi:fido (protein-threonine AMPylation protein)
MALVVAGQDRTEARRLQRMAEEGRLRRLHKGIYTDDLGTPIEVVTRRHLNELCGLIMPGCIVSHRSAIEQRPTAGGQYFVTSRYRRDLDLPGVKVRAAKGPGPLPSDVRIPYRHGDVYISGQARSLLENLQFSRGELAERRTLGVEFIEQWLDRFLRTHTTNEVNKLRDVAREIAESIGMREQSQKLDRLIGALLGTRKAKLATPVALARAARQPYDSERLKLFESLARELQHNPLFAPPADSHADAQLQAFIETYFSNFIEGTEFEIDVAHDIVVSGRPIKYREDDSHDILGTYQAILKSKRDPSLPESAEAFVKLLRDWNRQVIESRRAKEPGEFKTEANRAGRTVFVQPEMVLGTLIKGYEYVMSATTSANRAALAMFVVAEVHPFNDGNGRTARIAMNHFLTNAGLTRIIIPTIYRDDYLTALKAMTNGHPEPMPRMLSYAARFSRWLDMSAKDPCFAALEGSHAMQEDHKQFRLTFDDAHLYEIEGTARLS